MHERARGDPPRKAASASAARSRCDCAVYPAAPPPAPAAPRPSRGTRSSVRRRTPRCHASPAGTMRGIGRPPGCGADRDARRGSRGTSARRARAPQHRSTSAARPLTTPAYDLRAGQASSWHGGRRDVGARAVVPDEGEDDTHRVPRGERQPGAGGRGIREVADRAKERRGGPGTNHWSDLTQGGRGTATGSRRPRAGLPKAS